jgi:hypothetical protein
MVHLSGVRPSVLPSFRPSVLPLANGGTKFIRYSYKVHTWSMETWCLRDSVVQKLGHYDLVPGFYGPKFIWSLSRSARMRDYHSHHDVSQQGAPHNPASQAHLGSMRRMSERHAHIWFLSAICSLGSTWMGLLDTFLVSLLESRSLWFNLQIFLLCISMKEILVPCLKTVRFMISLANK